MPVEHDYYTILSVPRDASDAEIRRAFRALAKEHHPDKRQNGAGGSPGCDFSLITEAYETLKDRTRRAAYDEGLNQTRQLSAPASEKGKRPFAFAAGLGVGITIAIVAIGAVTYAGRFGGKSSGKAQDSLKGETVRAAKTSDRVSVPSNESAPKAAANSSTSSEAQPAISLEQLSNPLSPQTRPSQIEASAESPAEPQTASLEPAAKSFGKTGQPRTLAPGELIEIATGRPGRETLRRLEPGNGLTESFADCPSCPEMVAVPNGQTLMGSRPESDGYRSEEAPPHRVHIGKPLAVSKYVISAGNWRVCVDAGVCRLTLSSLLAAGPRVAATRLSWFDAKAYVEWLSQTTGWRYRLLTEAEWEYVARARKGTMESEAGHNRYALDATKDISGAFPRVRFDHFSGAVPNAWGIQGGGVLEWVEDCWHPSYDQAPNDGSPWLSAAGRRLRLSRCAGQRQGRGPVRLAAFRKSKGIRRHQCPDAWIPRRKRDRAAC